MQAQGLIFDMRSICDEIFEHKIISYSLIVRHNGGSGALVEFLIFWRFAVKGQCPRPLDDGDVLEGRYSTINFHLYIKKIVFPLFLVSKLASNLPLFVLRQANVVYTP